jgi:hypothetical protein
MHLSMSMLKTWGIFSRSGQGDGAATIWMHSAGQAVGHMRHATHFMRPSPAFLRRCPPPEPLRGPIRFGPYTLARKIGAGGMGEVYLAREESPRRACVVKKVLPRLMENKQFLGRFRDEARVVVQGPPCVNPGDMVRVSPKPGEYLSRA